MDKQTPVVIVSGAAPPPRFTLTCPWCGTVNVLPALGMRPLPGCGHVVGMQWRDNQHETDSH